VNGLGDSDDLTTNSEAVARKRLQSLFVEQNIHVRRAVVGHEISNDHVGFAVPIEV